MTRLTEEQITQKAREAYATDNGWSERGRNEVLLGLHDHSEGLKRIRQGIIATLTEYAPHLLPRDADEELAEAFAKQWLDSGLESVESVMLRLIKHMRESGK